MSNYLEAHDPRAYTGPVVAPDAERPYVLETWMGRRILPLETFATFDAARGRVSELAEAEATAEHGPEATAGPAWLETFDGVCEDTYAEERYGRGFEVAP